MNQQCKVCGEPAAGFHFGAFTCEGCKSFFGRTYNNLGSISECKNGGVCVINKKNRTACKACRLRKCLMVGMSKSGSRYGRRSNWFKIHCLLQEQSNGGSQGVGGGGGGGGPFAGGFLPGFLPPSQSHAHHAVPNAYASKEAKERGAPASPSQEDLALQSHLLHVAIMKQERERGNKSPHPDDVALQNQLRLLAWQKERERASQHQHHHHHQQNHHHQHQHQQHQHQQPPGTPPRDSSPPFGFKHRASPIFPINFAQEKMTLASSPPRVFRPFLPTYKRTADTPSDSGASSSVEPGEHDESGSNSALSYFKASAASPTLSEREFPRKINATVTLTTTTTGYHPHRSLVYPPPGLVTPAASQHSPRGGDLLLVSPSPGGLAIEQDEPIDLSVRTSRSSPRPGGIYRNEDSDSPLNDEDDDDDDDDDDDEDDEDDDDDRSSRAKHRETTAKSKPLDLTLGLKRPAELFLTL